MTGHPAGWPVSATIVWLLLNRLSLTFISATYPPIISSRCVFFFFLLLLTSEDGNDYFSNNTSSIVWGIIYWECFYLVRLELNIQNFGKFFSSLIQILNHLFWHQSLNVAPHFFFFFFFSYSCLYFNKFFVICESSNKLIKCILIGFFVKAKKVLDSPMLHLLYADKRCQKQDALGNLFC